MEVDYMGMVLAYPCVAMDPKYWTKNTYIASAGSLTMQNGVDMAISPDKTRLMLRARIAQGGLVWHLFVKHLEEGPRPKICAGALHLV